MKPYYEDDHCTIYNCSALEVDEWLDADVMVADPPYGMKFRSSRGGVFGVSAIQNDDSVVMRDKILEVWQSKPALVFGRWSVKRPDATRMVLTWEKGEHVGMGDLALPWKPNTEEIYVIGDGFTGRRTGSVLRCNAIAGTVGQAGRGDRFHPTEKPVGLLKQLLVKCPSGVIADPFMGSGTTLRAAKDLGRKAIGVEVEEKYCEIAASRLSQEVLAF